jgi:hypothetical protein
MNRTTTRAGAKSIDSDLSGHPLAASVLDRVPSQAQSLFLPILSMEDGRPLDPPYITAVQQAPPAGPATAADPFPRADTLLHSPDDLLGC